ncbi:MAG: sirohydrochlorin chelatase [Oscillatoriales cyanobacterium RM2_1_1]|nr:sirohydrochlorin chelatase [Oscillatoriales cyanobacterium SM2_3_0]NJO46324.1 sirohydrochlorin chelatase [Oscillatoriales cyanobacterium RM2_1_1]
MSSVYLLIAHGSRDPNYPVALEQLARDLERRLEHRLAENIGANIGANSHNVTGDQAPITVGTGTLECAPISLHQQIQHFFHSLEPPRPTAIRLFPLFLFSGVHVQADIPLEIAMAREALGSEVHLEVLPYLGAQTTQITQTLQTYLAAIPVDTWVIVGHGSRRPRGNQPMERLAHQLAAVPAYWSVSPSLDTQVQQLIHAGIQTIGILPYFIFSGGITGAIQQDITRLGQRFPQVKLALAQPLDHSGLLLNWVEAGIHNSLSRAKF